MLFGSLTHSVLQGKLYGYDRYDRYDRYDDDNYDRYDDDISDMIDMSMMDSQGTLYGVWSNAMV